MLRTARQQQGRTLREVSSTARVSLGYLSEVERGQKEASSELLASICGALDVPLANVLLEVSHRMAPAGRITRPDAGGAARASTLSTPSVAAVAAEPTVAEAAVALPSGAGATGPVVTDSIATDSIATDGSVEGPAARLGIAPLGLDAAASLMTTLPETLTLRQIRLPEPIVAA